MEDVDLAVRPLAASGAHRERKEKGRFFSLLRSFILIYSSTDTGHILLLCLRTFSMRSHLCQVVKKKMPSMQVVEEAAQHDGGF